MNFKTLSAALKGVLSLGLTGVALAVSLGGAVAQDSSIGGINLQDVERRLRDQGNDLSRDYGTGASESSGTLRPNLPYPFLLPASSVEKYYSQRAGTDLKQFGYESFGRPSDVSVRQMGALQDTYIVGVGDQINLEIRGQESRSYSVRVNRDGNVVLPGLSVVPAAGRQLADVRADIEQRVKTAYIATQAYVSIGAVRQIGVLVSGEVMAPGPVTLSGLNSPVDAILLAGGIKKTGSLRQIRIIRGDQEFPVDLYAALAMSEGKLQLSLTDGDKIVVPPLNQTVAITGEVTRPGIFEIGPGASSITVSRLLALAGGYARGGAPRLSMLKVSPNGSSVMTPITNRSGVLRKGDILFVQPANDVARGRVVLEGQVRVAGAYDLSRAPTLRALLGAPETYEEQPYMLFAAISRRDLATMSRKIVPFAPLDVVQGRFDLQLQDDDIIRIFSVPEVRLLARLLSNEDGQRNPNSRDLRSSGGSGRSSGASQSNPGGGQPQGTVGAALAGQGAQTQGAGSGQTSQQDLQTYAAQLSPEQRAQAQAYLAQGGQIPSQLDADTIAGLSGTQSQPEAQPVLNGLPMYRSQSNSGNRAAGPVSSAAEYAALQAADQAKVYNPANLPLSANNLRFDLTDPSVRSQIAGYRVSLLGAVDVPGDYLAAPGVGLAGLVGAAGGLTITADLSSVEVTSTTFNSDTGRAETARASFSVKLDQIGRITLRPRDVVRFREVYSDRDGGQVTVRGQVRFPGSFDILRGERLSSLLARAGGLTDIAYPSGAVFTRESAARAEEDGYRRAADELERDFTVLAAGDERVTPQGVQFIRDTIERLHTAQGVGRISIEADPVLLASKPTRDMILEPGDFLFVPRRPNSVSVTGEVLSAGSYLFRSGSGGRHYIALAGGFAPAADEGRTFVLMPDGTARPLTGSVLTFRQASLVPGATIIVPRDLRPFRFFPFALSLTQIMSQLAVSAASIAVISNNNN